MAKKATKKKARAKSESNGHDEAPRPRQQAIPGTERKVHADVRTAAEDYVEVRDKRQRLTEREVEAKGTLMGLMKKHKLTTYIDEDAEIEVEIVPVDETVKVRHYDAEKAARRAAKAAEAKAEESSDVDESFDTPPPETSNGASNGAASAEASAP